MKTCLGIIVLAIVLVPLLSLIPAFLLWASWTWYGIGITYFNFLPPQFHFPSFWDCFFFLMAVGTVGQCCFGKINYQNNKS